MGGGGIISGIGLSGSDSDDKESNLLWVSREAVVSNKYVEKSGIPQSMHSHTMFYTMIYSGCYTYLRTCPEVYVVPDIASIATIPPVLPYTSASHTSHGKCKEPLKESGPGFDSMSQELPHRITN